MREDDLVGRTPCPSAGVGRTDASAVQTPDMARPDAARPDTAGPDTAGPDAARSDATWPDTARAGAVGGSAGWLAVVALVLVAVNLRPAVTSVGPVLQEARRGLGMSATVAGLLTSLPSACFAVFGFAAPRLARRFGPSRVIAFGAVALAGGLALRPFTGSTALFVCCTVPALAGIAVANVLLPVVVKQRFPHRVGTLTGVYTMALNLGAAAAGAVTVPLSRALGGWQSGLAAWAVLASVAAPPWLALARRRDPAVPDRGARAERSAVPLARSPLAWALASYFGLQAAAAYVVMGWLPQMFRDAGVSAEAAGLLFSMTMVLAVPLSYGLGALAGRLPSQSGIAAGLGACGIAGYAGMFAAPGAAPWLWALLLGLANCSFPLALTMIGMRGRDSATVGRLSAFAQSTGYLMAMPVPVLVGALYQSTGGWRLPFVLLAGLMVLQVAAGVLAGRDRQLG